MIQTALIQPGTVSVLIGPNGSGKSILLRELCDTYLQRGENVIAIAPTIFDRFGGLSKKRFRFFGARQGQYAARMVVQTALATATLESEQIIKNITQALKYTKLDPEIGIKISDINPDAISSELGLLNDKEADRLTAALWKLKHGRFPGGIARISLDSYSFQELSTVGLAVLAEWGGDREVVVTY